ncbi:MAG: Mov34/MPN/PAD-1 family protein [Candidatus Thermoplasmatota archaeon]
MIFLLFKHKKFSWKIERKVLKMILECAKESYPKEFAGFLKAGKKFVINELILIPGTISGNEGALLRLHMLPVDFGVIGTIHSHPTISFEPSASDRKLFAKFGGLHIIASYPYNENSWKAYNSKGEVLEIEVVD